MNTLLKNPCMLVCFHQDFLGSLSNVSGTRSKNSTETERFIGAEDVHELELSAALGSVRKRLLLLVMPYRFIKVNFSSPALANV